MYLLALYLVVQVHSFACDLVHNLSCSSHTGNQTSRIFFRVVSFFFLFLFTLSLLRVLSTFILLSLLSSFFFLLPFGFLRFLFPIFLLLVSFHFFLDSIF